jgi:hypothetical protein
VKACHPPAPATIDSIGAWLVEAPTPDALLLGAHAALDVLWWDPMADETRFYQHAPLGHALCYDPHAGLTAM